MFELINRRWKCGRAGVGATFRSPRPLIRVLLLTPVGGARSTETTTGAASCPPKCQRVVLAHGNTVYSHLIDFRFYGLGAWRLELGQAFRRGAGMFISPPLSLRSAPTTF